MHAWGVCHLQSLTSPHTPHEGCSGCRRFAGFRVQGGDGAAANCSGCRGLHRKCRVTCAPIPPPRAGISPKAFCLIPCPSVICSPVVCSKCHSSVIKIAICMFTTITYCNCMTSQNERTVHVILSSSRRESHVCIDNMLVVLHYADPTVCADQTEVETSCALHALLPS